MQQSKQKLCMTHQEVITQKNYNDKDLSKTYMEEIQYKNEIIQVEEAIKKQQMIMENSKLNIYQQKQMLSKFNYQLIEEQEYPQHYYSSFVFNQDSTLLFAGGYQVIKVFKFKHGKKLLQKLSANSNSIVSLIFLNRFNLLVSGSWDKSFVIWNQDQSTNWKPHQKLEGHQDIIHIMINNEDEDLIISGSGDRTIKFWRKTNKNWSCQQTIQTNFQVKSLSLNKSQTKLISCGSYSNEILAIELNQAQWNKISTIHVNCNHGLQLCNQECLEIYEYQQNEKSFIKQKTIGVQKVESYDNFVYACKYLESKGFAIVQYGKYLNFFRFDENQNCDLSYSIDFNKNWFIGNISNDGQYLVTRDIKHNMQVRKFKQLE